MISLSHFSNTIFMAIQLSKPTPKKLWVLLTDPSTRFRAAWGLALFIFENEREMRNGAFLIGARVHFLCLKAVAIQILCGEKCAGNVPQVNG